VQVQHSPPGLRGEAGWNSRVGSGRPNSPSTIRHPRCGAEREGPNARNRHGRGNVRIPSRVVVVIDENAELAHPHGTPGLTRRRGDAALVPVHLDVAPQDGHGWPTAASGPM